MEHVNVSPKLVMSHSKEKMENKTSTTEKHKVTAHAKKDDSANAMRQIRLDKVVLNIGATGDKLDKGHILLQKLTGKKPVKVKATKRIPTWEVRPGLEVGTKVTLRGKEAIDIIKKLLPAVDNTVKERQIQNNFMSFGIHEYIEIPGVEYIREVGIMGFEVTIVFSRAGKSVENKKVKRGKSRRLTVLREEIEEYLKSKFSTKILRKKDRSIEEEE